MIADLTRLIERATRLAYPMRVSPELHASRILANREKKGAGADRLTAMRALWDEGKTLAEIGDQYGMTRERVRQLFKRAYGETPMSVRYIETAYKKTSFKKYEIWNRKAISFYGVSRDTVYAHGDPHKYGTVSCAFKTQKLNATKRGIEWSLSLVEWVEIWKNSGHFNERGIGKGRYVMARIADQGGYSFDNVVIKTHEENSKEAREMDRARGTVKMYEIDGEMLSVPECAKKLGLSHTAMQVRLKKWPLDRALSEPKQKGVTVTPNQLRPDVF